MRVKLYVLSLLPSAVVSGWLTSELGRIVGPVLIAPRDIAFLAVMAVVGLGIFGLLNLIIILLLGLRLAEKGGDLMLVDRSQLAKRS